MTRTPDPLSPLLVQDLRCEYQDNPLGIDVVQPRLSWKLASEQRGAVGVLTAASARYHSLYGEIASSWQMRDGRYTLTIKVPANTTATVFLPGAEVRQVTEGSQTMETAEGVIQVSQEQEATVVEVGSGTYTFAYSFSRNNE